MSLNTIVFMFWVFFFFVLKGSFQSKMKLESPSVHGELIELGHKWTLEKSGLFLSMGERVYCPTRVSREAKWAMCHRPASMSPDTCTSAYRRICFRYLTAVGNRHSVWLECHAVAPFIRTVAALSYQYSCHISIDCMWFLLQLYYQAAVVNVT